MSNFATLPYMKFFNIKEYIKFLFLEKEYIKLTNSLRTNTP